MLFVLVGSLIVVLVLFAFLFYSCVLFDLCSIKKQMSLLSMLFDVCSMCLYVLVCWL